MAYPCICVAEALRHADQHVVQRHPAGFPQPPHLLLPYLVHRDEIPAQKGTVRPERSRTWWVIMHRSLTQVCFLDAWPSNSIFPQLLCLDMDRRLSCLSDLQALDFLSDINWDAVLSKQITPSFLPNASLLSPPPPPSDTNGWSLKLSFKNSQWLVTLF